MSTDAQQCFNEALCYEYCRPIKGDIEHKMGDVCSSKP